MNTLSEFIERNGITATVKTRNPTKEDAAAYPGGSHWTVKLRRESATFSVPFHMGSAHRDNEPELASVLDCLASDAASYENARGFEDWAREYDYDTDSRKAERVYRAIAKESQKLKQFLGDDLYEELLWNTERE